MTARPLPELVDDGWAKALEPVADQVAQMGQFLRTEIAAGRRYLPAGPNVLRAFTFPFSSTPCTWNTRLAISKPTRVTFITAPPAP